MTSPVGTLFRGTLNPAGAGSEFGPVVGKEQRRRLGAARSTTTTPIRRAKRSFRHQPHVERAYAGAVDLFPQAKLIACATSPG